MNVLRRKRQISTFQIIVLAFLGMILLGSFLLMLPISSATGTWTSFSDASFTTTSAVCVTGLIVRDTATHWSMFGQTVIIILIQIGGMGVITVATMVVVLAGKKMGLKHRSLMQESVSAHQLGGIVKHTSFIIKGIFFIEVIGAVLLFPVFYKEFGVWKGIWYSVFHSISAFCNAGFDLMGVKAPFSSLTSYVGHTYLNVVIILLIVIGGIGFLTWKDITCHKLHIKRYRMQSKVILTSSFFLILLPFLYFYFGEFSRGEWAGLSGGEKAIASAFQAVTPRTAGFNTVDYSKMSEPSMFVNIFLMLIGGSPGSTAGGMKTTTFMVLIFAAISVYRRKQDTQCFGRRIEVEIVRNAVAILLLYLGLFIMGSMILCIVEGLPIIDCMFECASAVGTVGVTVGITTKLGTLSRCVLMTLMFVGRVGGMTLVFATLPGEKKNNSKYPIEKLTVG